MRSRISANFSFGWLWVRMAKVGSDSCILGFFHGFQTAPVAKRVMSRTRWNGVSATLITRNVNDAFNNDDLSHLTARGSFFISDNSFNGTLSSTVSTALINKFSFELS